VLGWLSIAGPAGAIGGGCSIPVGEWQRASQREHGQQSKGRGRTDDNDKFVTLGSAGVEPMEVKRASVCKVLAVAKVKALKKPEQQ
jgi:hypothetical protein